MNLRTIICLGLATAGLWHCGVSSTQAQGTTQFSYQGRLADHGAPATGNYDFQFTLWDAGSGGNAIGNPVALANLSVTNGIFSSSLDFGAAFDGGGRWLEVAVRTNGGGGSYTTLAPRQPLLPVPYALTASNVMGNIPDAQLSTNIPRLDANPVFSGTPVFGAVGGAPFAVANSQRVLNLNADYLDGLSSTAFWQTGGNAGTTAGTQFLGTLDLQPLELKVNGRRALRLEPGSDDAVNIVAGSALNSVAPGTAAATISGGGITGIFGPGAANAIGSSYSTIGGGIGNYIDFGYTGGDTIAGGTFNYTSAGESTIGGGNANQITGFLSTIAGGRGNQAIGEAGAIAGGEQNRLLGGATDAAIGGGIFNLLGQYAMGATIGGGATNVIGGSAILATIGGGGTNLVLAGAAYSTIGGGFLNFAGSTGVTLAGGSRNRATDNYAVVGGGLGNSALGNSALVAGGYNNTAGSATGLYATVGGGANNAADGLFATIPGGTLNVTAGKAAFAAGYRARAVHDGAFVWADTTEANFASGAANEFAVRATGGIRLNPGNANVELASGGLKVTGAGVNTPTTAFIQHADASNTQAHITTISNPNCDGNPNAIILVTHNYSADTSASRYDNAPVGVYYDGAHWAIFHEDHATAMLGHAFNVLVIKP